MKKLRNDYLEKVSGLKGTSGSKSSGFK